MEPINVLLIYFGLFGTINRSAKFGPKLIHKIVYICIGVQGSPEEAGRGPVQELRGPGSRLQGRVLRQKVGHVLKFRQKLGHVLKFWVRIQTLVVHILQSRKFSVTSCAILPNYFTTFTLVDKKHLENAINKGGHTAFL
jgi:hypothetical protein